MSEENIVPAAETEAREVLGYYDDQEYLKYGTFQPPHNGLPVVHFSYVPLVSNRQQQLFKELESASKSAALRLDVSMVCKQLRRWDLKKNRAGDIADCRNAVDVAAHVDSAIIDGIANWLMESRDSAEAQAALRNFTTP